MTKITPTVAIIARIPVKEGHRDAAIEALQAMLANAETEPGTITYLLHTDDKDTNLLWFYEQFADRDAFKAHGSSEFMTSFGPKLAEHLARRPELTFLSPVGGKGL